MKFILIRWFILSVALFITTLIMPGIDVEGNGFVVVAVMAVILGLVNAIIRPILVLLSCGCIAATLGLFMLVINALTLWFASYICTEWLDIGFYVDGFLPAFFGSIVISIISWLLSTFLISDSEKG
jgi:putative membrane protein